MERWLSCKEIPTYEVSSEGRVRNSKTGRLMKTSVNSKGYPQVCLHSACKQYTRPIHRLVADAFYDGDHTGLDVNHIDGNKTNNHISNLEWCTRQENLRHAYDTGLKPPLKRTRVRIIETGEIFNSLTDCSKAINGDRCQIRRCLDGKEKTCRGYHFELV